MSMCKDCPHIIGDLSARDCAFPNCVGGWQRAFEEQVKHTQMLNLKVEFLQRQLLEANARNSAGKTLKCVLCSGMNSIHSNACPNNQKVIKISPKKVKTLTDINSEKFTEWTANPYFNKEIDCEEEFPVVYANKIAFELEDGCLLIQKKCIGLHENIKRYLILPE